MISDVAAFIRAVNRTVTRREHEGRPARVVLATRAFDATVEDVWDAITSAERIPRWLMPITGELRLGGRYQLQGNAGGEIQRCEPPRLLAVTWEYGGEVSWVTVRLSEGAAGATVLELEHVAHVTDEWWDRYGPGATGVGWDLSLAGLALHLAGETIDPAVAATWTTSEEGKAFVRQSSDGWAEASIASGTEPEAARAAGARTTAFYTGEAGG